MGGARGGIPAGRRAAGHDHLARHPQRGHDAGPVEDRASGRDRRGLRVDRFLALQCALRAGAATPSSRSVPPRRRVEPDSTTVRSRDSCTRSRRSTSRRSPATCRPRRRSWATPSSGNRPPTALLSAYYLMRLLEAAGLAAGRDQLRLRRLGRDLGSRARQPRPGGRALHREHGRLQHHVADDRRATSARYRSYPRIVGRDRRQGLHRRAPVGRPRGARRRHRAGRLRVPGAEVLGRQPRVRAGLAVARECGSARSPSCARSASAT